MESLTPQEVENAIKLRALRFYPYEKNHVDANSRYQDELFLSHERATYFPEFRKKIVEQYQAYQELPESEREEDLLKLAIRATSVKGYNRINGSETKAKNRAVKIEQKLADDPAYRQTLLAEFPGPLERHRITGHKEYDFDEPDSNFRNEQHDFRFNYGELSQKSPYAVLSKAIMYEAMQSYDYNGNPYVENEKFSSREKALLDQAEKDETFKEALIARYKAWDDTLHADTEEWNRLLTIHRKPLPLEGDSLLWPAISHAAWEMLKAQSLPPHHPDELRLLDEYLKEIADKAKNDPQFREIIIEDYRNATGQPAPNVSVGSLDLSGASRPRGGGLL